MICVGRNINGIALNDYEYLLDENGEKMLFTSEEQAKEFLLKHGVTEEEMYWFVFQEVKEENRYARRNLFGRKHSGKVIE